MAGPATNKTKSFDYAQDVTKQVLTLATAVVTITVSFLKDIAKAAPADARTVLYIAWALFALSVLGGVATLLNLTGRVKGAEESSDGIMAGAIRIFSILQLSCFVLAIVGTIYFGARAFDAKGTKCPSATSPAATLTTPSAQKPAGVSTTPLPTAAPPAC